MLVAARLVYGLGKATAVLFLADVCRATAREQRTLVILLFNIAFQVGLLAPAPAPAPYLGVMSTFLCWYIFF